MRIWELILGLGAVGSLAMWLRDVFLNHRSFRELVYPALTLLLASASVILYSKNVQLLEPSAQAKVLVSAWPETTFDGRFHEAQAKGIVLAGLQYLEAYRELFPESYERHKAEYEKTDFSDSIQATNAADSMITAIRSYAGQGIPLQ